MLADEGGACIRRDILGILCARALGIKAVATPVSCNSAVELAGMFSAVRRTRIGSPFVIEAMNALINEGQTTVCGYEANGGFLLGTAVEDGRIPLPSLPTRDAVLPIITVLVDARRRNVPLSALQAQLPPRDTFSERLQKLSDLPKPGPDRPSSAGQRNRDTSATDADLRGYRGNRSEDRYD